MSTTDVKIDWINRPAVHSEYNIYRSDTPIDILTPGTPFTTVASTVNEYLDVGRPNYEEMYYVVEGIRIDDGSSDFGFVQRIVTNPSLYLSHGNVLIKSYTGGGDGFEVNIPDVGATAETRVDVSVNHIVMVLYYNTTKRRMVVARYDGLGEFMDETTINSTSICESDDIMAVSDTIAICTYSEGNQIKATCVDFTDGSTYDIDVSFLPSTYDGIRQMKVMYSGKILAIASDRKKTQNVLQKGIPIMFDSVNGVWEARLLYDTTSPETFYDGIVSSTDAWRGYKFAPMKNGSVLFLNENGNSYSLKLLDNTGNVSTPTITGLSGDEIIDIVAVNHPSYDMVVATNDSSTLTRKLEFVDGNLNVLYAVEYNSFGHGPSFDAILIHTKDRSDPTSDSVVINTTGDLFNHQTIDGATNTLKGDAEFLYWGNNWTGKDSNFIWDLINVVEEKIGLCHNPGKYHYL